MQTPPVELIAVPHRQLTAHQLDQLRFLFDQQYLATHGDWDPEQPYGYAPHDVHLIAATADGIVGHVGWARRAITVGGQRVIIAGVGGVLVSPAGRGAHLGQRLMEAAHQSMLAYADIEFGYLGCDESVAAFYASCGWHRISAPELWTNREGQEIASPPGQPLFIRPVHGGTDHWPSGEVDLKGRPW